MVGNSRQIYLPFHLGTHPVELFPAFTIHCIPYYYLPFDSVVFYNEASITRGYPCKLRESNFILIEMSDGVERARKREAVGSVGCG